MTPNILTAHDIFRELCKQRQQWGLYFSISFIPGEPGCEDITWDEVHKAAPYLSVRDTDIQVLADGCGYVFGTEAEVQQLYDLTVGDDGPTKLNPYNGPARVYALTCGPNGDFMNENT